MSVVEDELLAEIVQYQAEIARLKAALEEIIKSANSSSFCQNDCAEIAEKVLRE